MSTAPSQPTDQPTAGVAAPGGDFDPEGVAGLVARLVSEVTAGGGVLPAAQLAVAHDGKVVCAATVGSATPAARFNIFSITKAVVAAAVWQLFGEGRLAPGDRVGDVIPEFSTNGKQVVTVEQLLTHTAGFPHAPLGPPDWFDRAQRLERFRSWRLNWEPGSRMEYHPSSAHWVLAELIERIDGRDFRDAIYERVSLSLGLPRLRVGATSAHPDDWADVVDIAMVGDVPSPEAFEEATGIAGLDLGEVTDETTLRYNEPAVRDLGVPGGGGIGSAADVALFYQALLHNPGGLWDPAWLADGTGAIRCQLDDPLLGVPANRSLGLVVAGDDGHAVRRGFGKTVSPRAFGHLGLGAQVAWADPDTGLSFCFLTNGHDADMLRMGRRAHALSSRAGALRTT